MTTPGITQELARFVADTRYDDLPESVVERTRSSIIDTFGVMVAGRTLGRGVREITEAVTEGVGAEDATIIGRSTRSSVRAAAVANAATTHQLDFDDTHDVAVAHPTANSLPISLALAEQRDLDGRALLEAVAVGNEVTCRLGESLTRPMFDYVWVRPPVIGMFGAVAAASRILGFDAGQVANAWGLLLPRVGGTLACLVEPGSWVRTMRDAFSVESALLAVQLAARGVQGERKPFEGSHGFFSAYFNGDYDPNKLIGGLGEQYSCERISIKPWACCREVHCTLTALFDAMAEHDVRGEQIKSICVHVGQTNLELCEPGELRRHPKLATDALCNIPFNVAVGAVYGRIPLDAYSEKGLKDPAVADMAERVTWVVDERQNRLGTLEPGALEITLTDGSVITGEAELALGHPERPLDERRLADKYHSCFAESDVLRRDHAERLYGLLAGLEQTPVREVTACLRP